MSRRELATLVNKGEETLRVLLRTACREDLWTLLTEVLFHPQIDCDEGKCCARKRGFYEPLHRQWCEWAQDEATPRKLLLAPRGHFKSTVVSFGRCCHAIVRNPDIRILMVSALEQNAKNFCRQVKAAFQRNERMAWLYPELCTPPDSQLGSEHGFTSPGRRNYALASPTFVASYLDAPLASQHYDLIILDDPIEAKHVATEDQAAKARGSYNKILPLLDPPTPDNPTGIIVVGTRWAYFDLYSGMLTTDEGGTAPGATPFKTIVRASFERDGKADFDSGDPIFPTRFSRTILMQLLEEARTDDRLGESFWWMQYMNSVRAPHDQPFQDEWFGEVDAATLPPLFAKMIVVDTALKDDVVLKKGARGDYTVIMVGGWDREGRLYMIDGLRSNAMTSKLFTDALVTFAQKYQVTTVVKQRVSEDTAGTIIRDAFAGAMTPLDYRAITVQWMGRKFQRIKDGLQGPMQAGQIWWVKRARPDGTGWEHHRLLDYAKRELINLGQYPTDDIADCMANFFHPDVKIRRQNLAGPAVSWRIPHAPLPQLGNEMRALWAKQMLEPAGSGARYGRIGLGRHRVAAGYGDQD